MSSLTEFIKRIWDNPSPPFEKHNLGAVSKEQAAKIKEATGIDVEGFQHTVDSYAVRHIVKNHGDRAKEESRGQEAVTPESAGRILAVSSSADSVEDAGKNRIGRESVRFIKEMFGRVFVYVAEIRCKRRELAATTFYQRKKGGN